MKKMFLIVFCIVLLLVISKADYNNNKISDTIDNNNYIQYRIQQSNIQLKNELTSNK